MILLRVPLMSSRFTVVLDDHLIFSKPKNEIIEGNPLRLFSSYASYSLQLSIILSISVSVTLKRFKFQGPFTPNESNFFFLNDVCLLFFELFACSFIFFAFASAFAWCE